MYQALDLSKLLLHTCRVYVHIVLGTTNYLKLLQSPFRVLPPSVSKQPGGYGSVRWTAHTFSHPQNMLVQWIGIFFSSYF